MKINRSIPSLIKHLRPIPLYFIVGNESFYHCEKKALNLVTILKLKEQIDLKVLEKNENNKINLTY